MTSAPARLRLIGLPHDSSSSFLRGAAEAPAAIRAALESSHWNSWSELGQDLAARDTMSDAGDVLLSA
ncbi:MAG: arginase family protein, partial [Gemmatimonadales bacterium]